jgi:hypothetical protein
MMMGTAMAFTLNVSSYALAPILQPEMKPVMDESVTKMNCTKFGNVQQK